MSALFVPLSVGMIDIPISAHNSGALFQGFMHAFIL
jgi:hypothetical protein